MREHLSFSIQKAENGYTLTYYDSDIDCVGEQKTLVFKEGEEEKVIAQASGVMHQFLVCADGE